MKLLISFALMALVVVGVGYLFLPAIPQPQSYHAFADQPPVYDVLSSLLLIPLGIWGCRAALPLRNRKERSLWQIFFVTVILIGLGSSYYHVQPTNERLVLDRLPIAIAFMTLLCILIGERVGIQWGVALLPLLGGIGIFSVIRGMEDLRLYILWVHILPLLTIPLLARSFLLFAVWGFIMLSRVFEIYDGQIYALLHQIISGHTLKHLSSAAAVYCLIRYCRSKVR